MTMTTRISVTGRESRNFVCLLSLERCRHYLAHMHAMLHHTASIRHKSSGGRVVDDSFIALMAQMDRELNQSLDHLRER